MEHRGVEAVGGLDRREALVASGAVGSCGNAETFGVEVAEVANFGDSASESPDGWDGRLERAPCAPTDEPDVAGVVG